MPADDVEGQQVIGAARGSFTLDACLAEGSRAGAIASFNAGFVSEAGADARSASDDRPSGGVGGRPPTRQGVTRPLWVVRGRDGDLAGLDTHFVDLQRDQTVADVLRATGAGMRSVEHIKRYTSISTANDQGKTSAVNAIGLIATALNNGATPGQVGTTTYRAPFCPARLLPPSPDATAESCTITAPPHLDPSPGTSPAEPSSRLSGEWLRPWYYPERRRSRWTRRWLRECAAPSGGQWE